MQGEGPVADEMAAQYHSLKHDQPGWFSWFSRPIGDLGLSARATNALTKSQVCTVKELVQLTERELLHMGGLGRVTVCEISKRLGEFRLRLGARRQAPLSEMPPVSQAVCFQSIARAEQDASASPMRRDQRDPSPGSAHAYAQKDD